MLHQHMLGMKIIQEHLPLLASVGRLRRNCKACLFCNRTRKILGCKERSADVGNARSTLPGLRLCSDYSKVRIYSMSAIDGQLLATFVLRLSLLVSGSTAEDPHLSLHVFQSAMNR